MRKKGKEDIVEELAKSFEQWEYLKKYGGNDPHYADGYNMNLVRNHILYYKHKIVEQYGTDCKKYPEIFYREAPPEVNKDYMARAGEIRDGAVQALECYIADPNFFYILENKDKLTEKEAQQIYLRHVLNSVSGLSRAIKEGDLVTMRCHVDRTESRLKSFALCAARMMEIINDKKIKLEQIQEEGQLSLFQLGMKIGQHR